MKKSLKCLSILLAGALLGSVAAQAQDKALLDTLVQKGLLTQQEAAQIAKESVVVKPAQRTTKSITFQGRIQTQYQFIQVDEKATTNNAVAAGGTQRATNDFIMRRLYLGATADLGNGWSGVLVADFAASGTGAGQRNYIDQAYIRKKTDWDFLQGNLDVGYKKVTFGQEENTSSASLLPIERSFATRYFAEGFNNRRLGFNSRHVGIFWTGTVPQVDGLGYGLALTTNQNQTFQIQNAASNTMSFWGNVNYRGSIEDFKYTVGTSYGYKPKGSYFAGPTAVRSAWGLNPYIQLDYLAATLRAEYLLADVENGQTLNAGSQGATPQGMNVTVGYTFDIGEMGKLQPVFRYSYLQTNGRGISIGDGIRNASGGGGLIYDNASSYYVGANWMIMGNAVKLGAGVEYAEFKGFTAAQAPGANQDSKSDVLAVRMQLQLLF